MINNEFDPRHPHEIRDGAPAVLDDDGRCLLCAIEYASTAMAQAIGRLGRLRQAVIDACEHDMECEEEGEGECCGWGWRKVCILADAAKNVTSFELKRALSIDSGGHVGPTSPS